MKKTPPKGWIGSKTRIAISQMSPMECCEWMWITSRYYFRIL